MNRPSIKDVAEHAGTSIGTVSNVLSGKAGVSDTLRAKVMQSVNALGYETNKIARSLKSGKTYSIGMLITDINCIFFPPMIKGVQNVLSKAGYSLSIFDSCHMVNREREAIESMRTNWVDGLILDSVDEDSNILQAARQEKGMVRNFPIVSVERDLSAIGLDSVLVDNRAASAVATWHLIETGCRRIAHISCGSNTVLARERFCGYMDALKDAGITFDPALSCKGDFSPVSGYEAVSALVQDGIRFDGVFSDNDQMAVGAMYALKKAGLQIPGDVRVVGFDNTFASSIISPALTTISVPNYVMGVQAAGMLLSRIGASTEKPRAVKLDYELIIRSSTVASAHTKWDMTYW